MLQSDTQGIQVCKCAALTAAGMSQYIYIYLIYIYMYIYLIYKYIIYLPFTEQIAQMQGFMYPYGAKYSGFTVLSFCPQNHSPKLWGPGIVQWGKSWPQGGESSFHSQF